VVSEHWNGYGPTPDDLPAAYDTSAFGRSADSWMDSAVDRGDPQWELEKQKARDFAARWLPTIRMSRKQAG
jgi:hypothetical protein